MKEGFVEKHLGAKEYEKLTNLRLFREIDNSKDLLHCMNTKCSGGIVRIQKGSKTAACEKCGALVCLSCQRPDHPGRGCKVDESKFSYYMYLFSSDVRPCPQCGVLI